LPQIASGFSGIPTRCWNQAQRILVIPTIWFSELAVQSSQASVFAPKKFTGPDLAVIKAGQILASIDSPKIWNLLQEPARLSSLRVEKDRQQITTRQQQLQNRKSLDTASIGLRVVQRELSRAQKVYEQEVQADETRISPVMATRSD
jgi:hypothetical protein